MRFTTLIAAALLALITSTAKADTLTYDYDRTADFTKLRTYAWVLGAPIPDELTDRRIVAAFDAQLATKGLAPTAKDMQPDVLVWYDASFGRDLQIVGSGGRLAGFGTARAERIVTATIALEIVDAKTGAPLWHGVTSHEVNLNASPESRDREIAKMAEKLLRKYPASPVTAAKAKKS